MSQPYPISREAREEAIFLGDGGSAYGPFDLKIFDIVDVKVWTMAQDAAVWVEASPTVTKTGIGAFDTFSIVFPYTVPTTTKIKVLSARVHERSAGILNGTMLNPDALEKELSKQGTTLQELRRDIDRSVQVQFGAVGMKIDADLADGDTLMKSGNRLVKGANASDILLAQGYAENAAASEEAAGLSAIDAALSASSALASENEAADSAVYVQALIDSLGLVQFSTIEEAAAAIIPPETTFIQIGGQNYGRITSSFAGLGGEIISTGDFSSAGDWSINANWSISGGVATHTPGAEDAIGKLGVLTVGQPYFTSYDIVTISAGSVRLLIGTGKSTVIKTSVGHYEEIAICAGSQDLFVYPNGTSFAGSVDNVSVRALPTGSFAALDGDWWGITSSAAGLVAVSSRAALKALSTAATNSVLLTEAGRSGIFVFRPGNYSAQIAADVREGIFIKSDGSSSATGAWVRVFDGRVNVRWFGAVGDGVADDTIAFNLACSSVTQDNLGIYIPSGRYLLTNSWNISGRSIGIFGDGAKATMLFFSGDADAVVYNAGDLSRSFTIKDLSIVSLVNTTTGAGLKVIFPSNSGSSWKNCTIRDVVVDSSDTIANYLNGNDGQDHTRFAYGMHLENVAGLTIDNVHVRGRYSTKNSIGILVKGWTVDMKISNCILQFHDIALFKQDALEGFNVSGVIGLACNEFIRIWNGASHNPANPGGVYGYIANCHSGCSVRGIDIRNYPQVFITNCLLYKDGASTTYTHIYCSAADNIKIIGNHLSGGDPSNSWNIQLIDTFAPIVEGNFLYNTFYAVQSSGSTSAEIVAMNHHQGALSVSGSAVTGLNKAV